MYKYLLFDADNTLLDFDAAEKCAVKETLTESPIGYSEEIYSRYHIINDEEWKKLERGETTREVLRIERFKRLYDEYGLDGDRYAEPTADAYVDKLSMQGQMMPDAEEVLSRLYKNYSIYIITNGITGVQKYRMAATPLEKYITHSFISQEMGLTKPAKTFFDAVISYIGDFDTSAYLVIGDSLTSDIAGAVGAGIDSVWLSGGKKSDMPTYTIEKLRDLYGILQI